MPSGKTIDVPYEAGTTVKQIKAEIHESQPDIAEETLKLTFSGKQLADTALVKKSHIPDGQAIHVVTLAGNFWQT